MTTQLYQWLEANYGARPALLYGDLCAWPNAGAQAFVAMCMTLYGECTPKSAWDLCRRLGIVTTDDWLTWFGGQNVEPSAIVAALSVHRVAGILCAPWSSDRIRKALALDIVAGYCTWSFGDGENLAPKLSSLQALAAACPTLGMTYDAELLDCDDIADRAQVWARWYGGNLAIGKASGKFFDAAGKQLGNHRWCVAPTIDAGPKSWEPQTGLVCDLDSISISTFPNAEKFVIYEITF